MKNQAVSRKNQGYLKDCPADQWLLSSVRFAAAVTVSGRQNDGMKHKVNKAMIEEARGRIATMAT
jgi:hypothetical protein